jgi:hypothetical protein
LLAGYRGAEQNPAAEPGELSDLDRRIGSLEGDLMTAVAKRPGGGSAAAAEGEHRFAREVILVALSVDHFNHAVRIVNP